MTKKDWTEKIVKATTDAGTYRPFFDAVIETLATILERRDRLEKQYKKNGSEPVVEHRNNGGSDNMVINPELRLINELNRDALAYWRDLGLTPAGLRKINDEALNGGKKKNALVEALKELGS